MVVYAKAIPIATPSIANDFPALPHAFFCRPAEVVAPELIGCRLVRRQADGGLLWGVIVETEAYSQLVEVQKGNKAFKDLQQLLIQQTR